MPVIESPIKIRWAEFDRLTAKRGWTTDKVRAEHLKISQAFLSNCRAGRARPGVKFISQCMSVLGGDLYDVLFELESES